MRKLLTLAIPLLLGVGLLTAALNNPDQGLKPPRQQAGVAAENALPAVIEEATTTTTAAPAAPAPPTTLAAPATTTTTAKAAAKAPVTTTKSIPAPKPATTTTTIAAPQPAEAPAPTIIDCGTGAANARANLIRSPSGAYELAVTVVNESTKPIELDSLVVRAVYSGGAKDYRVEVAGKRIEARPDPSEASFSIPESSATVAPSSFEIAEFRFHTAGLPECASE